jgi:aspartate/methionine/tyrosine aminotransferase
MIKDYIAERMARLHGETAFAILARANALEAQGRSIVHLELGQPDFKTPQNIIDAACAALNAGYTGYTPTPGYQDLRETIADYALRHKNVKTNASEIVVVPGGKPVMFYTITMLVNPGEEVIYPNPSFPIYESCIKFAQGIPVPLRLKKENNFGLDVEELKRLITPKTKLIILNNPSNPTGGVYSKEDILALADILREHPDIFVLSDEIYDRLVFDGSVMSIASIPDLKDRVVILDGFSKTYAMTGWRLGYGIMHPDLAAQMDLYMANTNSCAAAFTQRAAIEALTGSQDGAEAMRLAFKERRDWLVAALNDIPGIECCLPGGAFYAFPDISSFGLTSNEFASRLLEEAGVAAAGGTSFGAFGEGFIRFSYANSLDNLKEAVRRTEKFVKTLR